MMSAEIFLPIKGYEGLYEVSNLGNVRSVDREWQTSIKGNPFKKIKSSIMKAALTKKGYKYVHLSKNGKSKNITIHRLVAIAFIKNPELKKQVNHKDGIKINNIVTNLEWATASENIKHAFDTGLNKGNGNCMAGIKNKMAKLNDVKVKEIRNRYSLGVTQVSLSTQYNVSLSCINGIVNLKRWRHIL